MYKRIVSHLLGSATLMTVLCAPAQAGVSAGAGVFTSTGTNTTTTANPGSGAVFISSSAAVPIVPVELQGTVLATVGKTPGYFATAEVRSGLGSHSFYIGAGLGFASVTNTVANTISVLGAGSSTVSTVRSNGSAETFFLGKSIAPLTSFEVRAYRVNDSFGTLAGVAALRFSI